VHDQPLTRVERRVYSVDFSSAFPVPENLKEIVLEADPIDGTARLTLNLVFLEGYEPARIENKMLDLTELLALEGFEIEDRGVTSKLYIVRFFAREAFDTSEEHILQLCVQLSDRLNGPGVAVDNCEILEEIADIVPGDGREPEWKSRGEVFAEKLKKRLH